MKKPLNWFFAQLFLSISSASKEQSQICAKYLIPEIILKVRFVNLWWYLVRLPMPTPHLRVQHHWHKICWIRKEIRRTSWWSEIVETVLWRWFLEGNWERTVLHYNWGRIWGYADSMSRRHSASKSQNIPNERVDPFKYENWPSLGRENLSWSNNFSETNLFLAFALWMDTAKQLWSNGCGSMSTHILSRIGTSQQVSVLAQLLPQVFLCWWTDQRS